MKMHDILCESSADRQPEIDEFGIQRWFDDHGKVHREDGPAVIYTNGAERWFVRGKLHRTDGPAVIYSDGSQEWYINGELHREDGPAIIDPDGVQSWWINGKRHRTDGPAIIRSDGTQHWYINGDHVGPVIPILLAAGATTPWHRQPTVAAKLSTPEQKKNIMRWLTRTARAGGNVSTAISALRKIGIKWPELASFTDDTTGRSINESVDDDGDDTPPTTIDPDGIKKWRNADGQLHRDNGPAVIYDTGTKVWYRNGKVHRDGKPAVIRPDGQEGWYQNDLAHRDDGPAMTNPNGEERWFVRGKLHRIGKPAVIYPDGTQRWFRHDKLHREDGPAVINADGGQAWWVNGQEVQPLTPILLSAGATQPWHAQPEVAAKLSTPEEKKNIMRWLTRYARHGGSDTLKTTINILKKIGVDWPELNPMISNLKTGAPA